MYSDKVMEHFRNPQNMGEIADADGIGKIGNPTCGDMMYCYIKVKENEKGEKILADIKVKTYGCVSAIATSSITTELAMGMTLEEAKKLTRDDVKDALDGLPPIKVHCSNLAADALHAAIRDYESKN
jgi:nitrogen fixation protein NifU and related proteins